MSVLELMEGRRTYRRFRRQPVPDAVLAAMEKAARLSSCGTNRQGLRFIWVCRPERIQAVHAHVRWAGALPPELGFPKPEEIPTLYLAVLGTGHPMDQVDAGIALANMTLAAWEQGVGSCIMGAIDRPALSELLGLDASRPLLYMVAFGYPDHRSTVVDVKDGKLNYYLDEQRNYCVPKLSEKELFCRD